MNSPPGRRPSLALLAKKSPNWARRSREMQSRISIRNLVSSGLSEEDEDGEEDVLAKTQAIVKIQARGKGMLERRKVQIKKAAGELPGQIRRHLALSVSPLAKNGVFVLSPTPSPGLGKPPRAEQARRARYDSESDDAEVLPLASGLSPAPTMNSSKIPTYSRHSPPPTFHSPTAKATPVPATAKMSSEEAARRAAEVEAEASRRAAEEMHELACQFLKGIGNAPKNKTPKATFQTSCSQNRLVVRKGLEENSFAPSNNTVVQMGGVARLEAFNEGGGLAAFAASQDKDEEGQSANKKSGSSKDAVAVDLEEGSERERESTEHKPGAGWLGIGYQEVLKVEDDARVKGQCSPEPGSTVMAVMAPGSQNESPVPNLKVPPKESHVPNLKVPSTAEEFKKGTRVFNPSKGEYGTVRQATSNNNNSNFEESVNLQPSGDAKKMNGSNEPAVAEERTGVLEGVNSLSITKETDTNVEVGPRSQKVVRASPAQHRSLKTALPTDRKIISDSDVANAMHWFSICEPTVAEKAEDKTAGTQEIKQSRAARQVSKMLLEMNSDGEDKATPQRFVSRRKSAPKGGDSDDDDYGLRPKHTAGSSCVKKAADETAADETANSTAASNLSVSLSAPAAWATMQPEDLTSKKDDVPLRCKEKRMVKVMRSAAWSDEDEAPKVATTQKILEPDEEREQAMQQFRSARRMAIMECKAKQIAKGSDSEEEMPPVLMPEPVPQRHAGVSWSAVERELTHRVSGKPKHQRTPSVFSSTLDAAEQWVFVEEEKLKAPPPTPASFLTPLRTRRLPPGTSATPATSGRSSNAGLPTNRSSN